MNYNNQQKIAIALSGGVDSAVASKILKDQGHELVGLFLKLWSDPTCQVIGENRCCDYEALEDARRVASSLSVPFYVVDAKDEFKREVVDYFIEEYKNLRTPNPCIVCNEKIKFDLLLKKALEIGCDKLATGHYARIEDSGITKTQETNPKQIPISNIQYSKKLTAESYKLKAGIDASKDQSYNLYRLNQNKLSKIIFPLGEMTKQEVRELAKKWDLPVKEKPESQEICFFGDRDYHDFLRRYLPEVYFKSGDIVDSAGNIIGKHDGLTNYTIGQRRNINQTGVSPRKDAAENTVILSLRGERSLDYSGQAPQSKKPLYVIGFNIEKNRLIVGEDLETYAKGMIISNIRWIDPETNTYKLKTINLYVKIRSQGRKEPCKIRNLKPKTKNIVIARDEAICPKTEIATSLPKQQPLAMTDCMEVIFDFPQRAVTPGQSAVFYFEDEVIGGGVIVSNE